MPTPPLPSPDDQRVLPASNSVLATALGHLLVSAFIGQIIFTVLQVATSGHIPSTGDTESSNKQLLLLVVPLVFALAGAGASFRWPIDRLGRLAVIIPVLIAICCCGVFNLIVYSITREGWMPN